MSTSARATGSSRFHGDLAGSLAWGLERIAHLAEQSANHDLVVQAGRREELQRGGDGDYGEISSVRALAEFLRHIDAARFRWYPTAHESLGPGGALAYGYTANNRREFMFFEELTNRTGQGIQALNVCDLDYRVGVGVDTRIRLALEDVAREFLRTRASIRPGLFAHLCKFGTSVQGAVATFEKSRSPFVVVANDHSPAPVAFTSVARALGLKTVYLQHAEVTGIFPQLEFDLSILRNRRSAEIYASIGPAAGEVVVARRQWDEWLTVDALGSRRIGLAKAAEVRVGVYPSRVFDADRLRSLVDALLKAPGVASVHVKPHPGTEGADNVLKGTGCEIVSEVPEMPHVAICGTSSVAADLLAHGDLVFHDHQLDDLSADYYGFLDAGLVQSLPPGPCPDFFWKVAATSTSFPWSALGRYLAHLDISDNRVLEEQALASVRDFAAKNGR
ncbi:MAG: hypothetical protein ACTMH5_09135 [Brachybacterium sp.]